MQPSGSPKRASALGNRRQHLEAGYTEVQEMQIALALIAARYIENPSTVIDVADRLGVLVYGLLGSEGRA